VINEDETKVCGENSLVKGEDKMIINSIKIGNKEIKNFGEPFVIAEIGSNHNGDIELAKQLIDQAIACGVDAVKFQAFDLSLFSKVCYEDDARQQATKDSSSALAHYLAGVHPNIKKEMQEYMTTKEMFIEIKKYCDEKEVFFTCTPLDTQAVDFLVDELGMEAIKVASCDLNNLELLDYMARKNKPIILSTGMGTLPEIVEAVETITKTGNNQLAILHCVSLYPPQDEIINLNNLDMLRDKFNYPIGFSDHSFGYSVPLAAIAKGACIIEKHFTLDKNMVGWDHKVSATPDEMKKIVEEGKKIYRSLGNYSRVVSEEEIKKRTLFRRSIVVNRDLPVGYVLTRADLDFKRPGIGIEPKYAKLMVGRTLKNNLQTDDLLKVEDLV